MIVGQDGGDARLLQHDFRDPDAVGVAAASPRKIAAVHGEPSEQVALKMRECVRREIGCLACGHWGARYFRMKRTFVALRVVVFVSRDDRNAVAKITAPA